MKIEKIQQFKQMCSNISVLMVDDEIHLTDNYKEIAERFFHKVETANSAQEAIAAFEVNKYDIIFTDLNMPIMDGIALIRTIKGLDPHQTFIVISASDESERLMEILSLQISSFILKPFSIEDFIQVTMDRLFIILQSREMANKTDQLSQNLKQVTQEKQEQEKMLIQQSKLAQTGEMISMIAHQWRQPLSSMTAVLASLKTRIELGNYENKNDPYGSLIPDVYTTFDKIEDSADYLSNTINDFRNFYRPDNKKVSFNICTAMTDVLRMLNLEQNGVNIEPTCIDQDLPQVYSYKGELKQVFISIINNAVDALQEHNIIDKKMFISIKGEDDTIRISIGDNAGGIPEDIIDDVFLPYFSTKDKKNGTGLGLHMAKNIIEEHMHGTLSVKNSTECGGALFSIMIPKDKNREET